MKTKEHKNKNHKAKSLKRQKMYYKHSQAEVKGSVSGKAAFPVTGEKIKRTGVTTGENTFQSGAPS